MPNHAMMQESSFESSDQVGSYSDFKKSYFVNLTIQSTFLENELVT